MNSKHEWTCCACGAVNSKIDGECQYCDCPGNGECERDNCSAPCHFTVSEMLAANGINWAGLTFSATGAFRYDDGGRAAAGYKGTAKDCVVRAICIAGGYEYAKIYKMAATMQGDLIGGPRSARNGISKSVTRMLLAKLGWAWTPTMKIGQGTKVHLVASELPSGRIIAQVTKHLVAVIDGVIHDTRDCSRQGTRCVYGYWTKGGAR